MLCSNYKGLTFSVGKTFQQGGTDRQIHTTKKSISAAKSNLVVVACVYRLFVSIYTEAYYVIKAGGSIQICQCQSAHFLIHTHVATSPDHSTHMFFHSFGLLAVLSVVYPVRCSLLLVVWWCK